MAKQDIGDLVAFVAVARERSFTRAAARMGVSQSALSHTIRRMEARLGVRLLTRTTRSVSATQAGERLLAVVAPRLEEIEASLSELSALRDTPAGAVRISATAYAADTILWPKLAPVLKAFPDISIEIDVEHGFTDIAARQFDAGVRLGEDIEKDMVAVRIGPDFRLVAVAAPSYLEGRTVPVAPRDLTEHRCVNLRLATYGGLYAWEFEKEGRALRVRVDGQVTFNSTAPMIRAALEGFGICMVPEDLVLAPIAAGALVQVLDDWCQPFSGFHLYYPDRRQTSPAFQIVVNALRHRDPDTLGSDPRPDQSRWMA